MIREILCYIRTYGKHIEYFDCEYEGDHLCGDCKKYLYTIYSFEKSLTEMRNNSKMWWETKE